MNQRRVLTTLQNGFIALVSTALLAGPLAAVVPIGTPPTPQATYAFAWVMWFGILLLPGIIIGTTALNHYTMGVRQQRFTALELLSASPDQRKQAWGRAREDLRRNLRVTSIAVLLFSMFSMGLGVLLEPSIRRIDEWVGIFGGTIFILALLFGVLTIVGTMLGHMSDLTSAALTDRAIVRERRTRAQDSELGGSLEVATATDGGGDLSLAVDAGAMEVHEEVALDFDTHEESEDAHVEAHQRSRS